MSSSTVCPSDISRTSFVTVVGIPRVARTEQTQMVTDSLVIRYLLVPSGAGESYLSARGGPATTPHRSTDGVRREAGLAPGWVSPVRNTRDVGGWQGNIQVRCCCTEERWTYRWTPPIPVRPLVVVEWLVFAWASKAGGGGGAEGTPIRFENEVAQIRCLLRFLEYFGGKLATCRRFVPRSKIRGDAPAGCSTI